MSNPFDGLAAILAALCPQRAASKLPAELEADAPERLRQIWQAIGLTELTGETSFRPRTRTASEEELAPILEQWSKSPKARAVWGQSAEAIRKALPERLRVVQALPERIGITDESTGLADPPVLMIRSETRRTLRWCETYTEWLTWKLLGVVAQVRLTGYNRLADLPSTRILDEAYPLGMYQLADRIWWMEKPRLDPEAEDPVIGTMAFYASVEDYSAYVFGLPEAKRAFMREPRGERCWLHDPGPLDLSKGTPEGFRPMPTVGYDGRPERGMRAIGRVGSWFVWLGMVADGDMAVRYNPAAHDEMSSWLNSLGLKVKQTEPLFLRVKGKKVGHDYYGW
jgi:hypothetical protein